MKIKDLRRGTIRNPLRNGFRDRVMISRFAPSPERQKPVEDSGRLLSEHLVFSSESRSIDPERERKVEQE